MERGFDIFDKSADYPFALILLFAKTQLDALKAGINRTSLFVRPRLFGIKDESACKSVDMKM